ncbi:MAG: ATP-binding cassette domain-containing protein [Chitinophagaceae bacterium]|nr:ATP-binding cassette domain-containing protein [Chitinophagaceae bacterium]MCW5928974.1 ATP-binding cassette domain-containing protein [Chitinophagaceae bacterium]
MENILEVKNLKKNFATQKAVDNVSFDISRGSVFGMLGPNGAGKTTLLRMITGIFYPDDGTILFEGKKFDPLNDIVRIGYMPEERGLYKKMKIGEQALYLARLKGLSKSEAMDKIRYWFERMEMQSWWNKKVQDLSKGMSQKLQFVTTILHEPSLVILDEPFSGLDPVNANLIKDEIFNLAKKGSTIIFSTHRMEQVEEICDHIILINKGEKILDGSVKRVKQDFKENLFQVGFERKPDTLPDNTVFETVGTRGEHFVLKIREGYKPHDVLQYLIAQSHEVISFNEMLPSLNDIFIKLVEGTPLARQFQYIEKA